MQSSAAEVCANPLFVGGSGNGVLGGFDDLHDPGHVFAEYVHGLYAFGILGEEFFGLPAEDHVPVLAVDGEQVGAVEIVLELMGCVDGTGTAAYGDGSGRLRTPAFKMFGGVKQTVERSLEGAGNAI